MASFFDRSTSMIGVVFVLVGLLLAVVAAASLGRSQQLEPWTKQLSVIQTALSIVALLVGGAWWFVERPHAMKLKLEQSGEAFPAGSGYAIVLAEVTLENLGGRSIRLHGRNLSIFLQQVTPVTRSTAAEFELTPDPKLGRRVRLADTYSLAASLHPKDRNAAAARLAATLEAGETESFYFRVVVPCKPQLRFNLTTWFERPPGLTERLRGRSSSWIKQTLVDVTEACEERA